MIPLYDYLYEASISDKKAFIKNAVDDLDAETINRIYNIVDSTSPEARTLLHNHIGGVGLEAIQDIILYYFEQNDDLVNYIHYLEQPNKMLKVKTITDVDSGNIVDICSSLGFDKKTIKRIALEKNAGGIKVGEYEYLLRLFLHGASDTINKQGNISGDVIADGVAIEVKSGKARISGAKTKAPQTILDQFNKVLNDKYSNKVHPIGEDAVSGGLKSTPKFWASLYDELKDADTISMMIASGYAAQWPETVWSKYSEKLIKFVRTNLFNGNRLNENNVNGVIASISLFCYACTENFHKFMVFNKTNGEYICLDCSEGTRNNGNLLKDAFNLFDTGKLRVHRLQSIGDTVYGKGIQFSTK